jgi:hypothetical protein
MDSDANKTRLYHRRAKFTEAIMTGNTLFNKRRESKFLVIKFPNGEQIAAYPMTKDDETAFPIDLDGNLIYPVDIIEGITGTEDKSVHTSKFKFKGSFWELPHE